MLSKLVHKTIDESTSNCVTNDVLQLFNMNVALWFKVQSLILQRSQIFVDNGFATFKQYSYRDSFSFDTFHFNVTLGAE